MTKLILFFGSFSVVVTIGDLTLRLPLVLLWPRSIFEAMEFEDFLEAFLAPASTGFEVAWFEAMGLLFFLSALLILLWWILTVVVRFLEAVVMADKAVEADGAHRSRMNLSCSEIICNPVLINITTKITLKDWLDTHGLRFVSKSRISKV